jgi:hypothetical protein
MPRLVDQWQDGDVRLSLFEEEGAFDLLEESNNWHASGPVGGDPVAVALAKRVSTLASRPERKEEDHG